MHSSQAKPNYFLYWAVCVVNLLSVNSASMFSWSSPSISILKSNDTSINPVGRPITSYEESLVASLSTFGSIIATLAGGAIGEKFGRKRTLTIFSTTFFIGYLSIANSTSVTLICVMRFIIGLGSGCAIALLSSYVGEISEDSNRGAMGSMFGLMSTVGHFLAFAVGPLVSIKTFAYILMVPVTLYFITVVPFVPESPYYYLSKGNTKEARNSLKKLRPDVNIEKEFLYLSDIVKESLNKKATLRDLFASRAARRGLLIVVGLLQFQQLLGIAVVLVYLQPVLEAGGNIIPADTASIIIAVVQVIACCLVTVFIERFGRKILLHISSVGCSLSMLLLGVYFILSEKQYNVDSFFWLPLASLILYYVFFSLGYSGVPYCILGEVLDSNYKSICASLSTCLCLVSSFVISLCFPFLRDAFGMGGVFCVFSVIGSLASIFVVAFVPETKGKSCQEIQYELSGDHKIAVNYESS